MTHFRFWRRALFALLATTASMGAWAQEGQPPLPLVSLIIDDLGDRLGDGLKVTALPGPVTCAILPKTTFSRRLAQAAHANGKEVMLHQPMQAVNGKAMGPGGMGLHMTRQAMLETLKANLASVPYARGINNHMGSLLTRHPGFMAWFMAAIQRQGELYFVDSTTTAASVAQRIAYEYQLPNTRRNIFLDNDRDEAQIIHQFVRLIQRARSRGHALAIGHPYPETLHVLSRLLPYMEQFGVKLVPVSELIAYKNSRREQLWQASLSPLHKGVKSLKR